MSDLQIPVSVTLTAKEWALVASATEGIILFTAALGDLSYLAAEIDRQVLDVPISF